jgi:hypothetical protein
MDAFRDRRHEERVSRRADVLVVSDGIVTVPIGERRLEVIADPFADLVRACGCDPLIWQNSHASAVPRYRPSARIQSRLDLVQASAVASRYLWRRPLELRGYDQFLAAVAAQGLPAQSVGPGWLRQAAARTAALSGVYGRLLRSIQPRLVAVNCYYSLQNMALIDACRRERILSVDLQHGVQGDSHIAYGRWSGLPEGGWDLLPDRFWCWSEVEAAAIRAWSPVDGRHQPLVGGNPWLELWRSGDSEIVKAMQASVETLTALSAGRRRVLVTLQWGMNDEAYLMPLLKAMQTAREDVDWWIRLHPLMLHRLEEIEQLLAHHRLLHTTVQQPTRLPLLALLRAADVHVTYSSSSVLEAAELGVSSVITGDYSRSLYADLIAAGRVFVTRPDLSDFNAMVCEAMNRRPQAVSRPGHVPQDAVRELLSMAGLNQRGERTCTR